MPDLEQMGIRMLLNECEIIRRNGECIYLSGIDDAHFYLTDNLEKAASGIPGDAFSILLSHTPEVYEEAAHIDFNLMLSGHTHGGQICLPGGIPIILNSVLPRYMGSGAWAYRGMSGYTSVGAGSSKIAVRFQLSAGNYAPLFTVDLTPHVRLGSSAGKCSEGPNDVRPAALTGHDRTRLAGPLSAMSGHHSLPRQCGTKVV